jgi:hypothetical protein
LSFEDKKTQLVADAADAIESMQVPVQMNLF